MKDWTLELVEGDWRRFLDHVLEAIRPQAPPAEYALHDADAAVIFMRVYSLLRGVRVLLRDGLGVEAGMLSRELFTDSLRLRHLAEQATIEEASCSGGASRRCEASKA